MLKRSCLISMIITFVILINGTYAQNQPVMIGWTYGTAQMVETPGDRIAVGSDGSVHFTWMKFFDPQILRAVYYNRIDPEGNVVHGVDGVPLSPVNGAGYPQLSIAQGDRAAIAYHSDHDTTVEDYVVYAVDETGWPDPFHHFDPPDLIRYHCYWPSVTVDRSDIVHIIAIESPPDQGDIRIMGHCYSTNGGYSWSKFVAVDTLKWKWAKVVASPVSEKVSIVYCHPTDLDWSIKNDVYFKQIKSDNNYIDYRSQLVNITEYGQNGDSLFAFDELDAIYDNNDNLHIIWSAIRVGDQGLSPPMFLYHYDYDSGVINEITSAAWQSNPDCEIPTGIFPIDNVSLGVSEDFHHHLYAVYTMFHDSDCSAAGYTNGDVYFAYSSDGGQSWDTPFNITNTYSDSCYPGDCHSEVSPSLADKITEGGYLYLSYIDNISGGDVLLMNPIYYYKYRPYIVDISDDGIERPATFTLLCAYPNPFNAKTTIEFALASPGDVEMIIYDITGAKVEIIRRPDLEAGRHSVVWNAKDAASGVYFARVEAGEESKSIRMVLLK